IAIEGLRSALSNIIKPSQEATKAAAALGIDFTAAGLKAKGFAGFLQEVLEKSKGDTAVLSQLFGDVQGLTAILSIAGTRSQNFARDLKGIGAAAGTIDEAFAKQQA